MSLPFQDVQKSFAAHLRHPDRCDSPPDVEDRRMQIYRDLFYSNIENFIANGFPVLRQLYADSDWHELVRDFFYRHRCESPYFLEIGQEFLQYLEQEREPIPVDPPFLLELAHYEWVELALDVSENEIPTSGFNQEGDLLTARPYISPLAWVLQYQYPVHKIGPEFVPQTPPPQPTFIVVTRDRQDQVKFMEINGVTARLLSLLQAHGDWSGKDAAERIIQELGHAQPDVVMQGAKQALEHLRQVGIILGTELKEID